MMLISCRWLKSTKQLKAMLENVCFSLIPVIFTPYLVNCLEETISIFILILFFDINYSVRLSDIDTHFLDPFKWTKIVVFLNGMTLRFVSMEPIDDKSIMLYWFFQ